MRLAANDIELSIGSSLPVVLRPSLRAAHLLERQHGFPSLFRKVSEGSVTAILDIGRANGRNDVNAAIEGKPLAGILSATVSKCAEYVSVLAGIDDEPAKGQSGKRLTYAEYHQELFKIAAGWLGWSAADAWAATPAEILAAYDGHVAMLRAIHGGKDESPANPQNTERDRTGLMSLKGHGNAV